MKKEVKKTKKHMIFSNMEPFCNCTDECVDEGICRGECDYTALDDERQNLNIKTEGRIIAIADVGRWNGRVTGYKILGKNINTILSAEADSVEWYGENKAIKGTMEHHDGTNYVEYREIREDINIENLLKKIYNQEEITRAMLNYYTKSIYPYVSHVYGW